MLKRLKLYDTYMQGFEAGKISRAVAEGDFSRSGWRRR